MFRIGEFARLNRVSAKLLRHYDDIGLLKPVEIDRQTGYRHYSAGQIPVLNRIMALKDLGFSLSEISELMKSNLTSEEMVGILKTRRIQIQNVIEKEKYRLGRVENLIGLFKREVEIMNYDIVVKAVESFRVASIRDQISDYGDQGHLWEELVTHIEKHGARMLAGCFASYYGEIDGKGVDAEVFEPIDRDIPGTERIKVHFMPAVPQMASIIHVGAYDGISLAYASITKWIEENGYRITGSEREIYLKGEWNSKDTSEYITEIQFPVDKKKSE